MSKPSVLICTPAYGGLVYVDYVTSLMQTAEWATQEDIPLDVFMMKNESLITRARNTCAAYAINRGFDKILFIDADIIWSTKDIWRLYYSDKKIIGGTYPIKKTPIQLNFNAIYEHRAKYFSDYDVSPAKFRHYALNEADETGEVEVEHIPTGFMMIDCSVIKDLIPKVEVYHSNHMLGVASTLDQFADLFQASAANNAYRSEDWFFCELARANGHKVWLNTNVILPHTGTHTFRGE